MLIDWIQNHFLTLLVFIPAAGALLALLFPKAEHNSIRALALGTTLVTFAVNLWAFAHFKVETDFVFQEVELNPAFQPDNPNPLSTFEPESD